MATAMRTDALGLVRLLQWVSPTLPVGAFSYSQGLEWAVEHGWVTDAETLADWLTGLMNDGLGGLDLPLLARAYDACVADDEAALADYARWLLAGRETRELRDEERQRARAMTRLLLDLDIVRTEDWRESLQQAQIGPFALAAAHWRIAREDCLLGYTWGWLENQVAAGIKLVPLGQTEGQRLLLELGMQIPDLVTQALAVDERDIGAGAPAMAIASSRHETQYTRLFRS